ncbi:MAG: SCO family protein [Bacteroidia bacterium]|nr:SCO family protein [Bacteroidia bacterium]
MAKRSILGPVVLIFVFVVPLLVYFFLFVGTKQQFNRVPFVYKITETGDTLNYGIPGFRMVNTDGDTVSQKNLLGNICIIGFYSPQGENYTNTALIGNLRRTFDNIAWEKKPAIKFILFSVEDSTSTLKAFTDSLGVDTQNWMFVSGSGDAIVTVAEGLGVPDFQRFPQPFTSPTVVLTDREGMVRKQYIATDLVEERKIQEDLITLLRVDYGL